jgi:hypothetical protein
VFSFIFRIAFDLEKENRKKKIRKKLLTNYWREGNKKTLEMIHE